jgi:hypothetical protein
MSKNLFWNNWGKTRKHPNLRSLSWPRFEPRTYKIQVYGVVVLQLRRLVVGFPPRRAEIEPRSGHVRFVVDRVVLGQSFRRVFRFPLPVLIPPTAPHSSSSIIQGSYNSPNTAWRDKVDSVSPTPKEQQKKSTALRQNQSQSYITIDCQSAILSWKKAPIYYCLTVTGFSMWSALSDERTGLLFARVTVSSNKSVVSMYNLYFTRY